MTIAMTTSPPDRLLAAIRIANGAIALLTPGVFASRMGSSSGEAAARYPFRLFGVRGVLTGCEMLWPRAGEGHTHEVAVLVHGSDLTAAVLAARRRDVSRSFASKTIALSALNTGLAVWGLARHRRG
jgi:hypothetical protein